MALIDVLKDPTKELELAVEISYRDPDTDTTGTKYYTDNPAGRSTGAAETPASTQFEPLVLDAGTVDEALSEDVLFSGLASPSLGTVRLSNTPTGPTVAGPLDSLIGLSFAGRDIVVKGGEKGAAYSTFQVARTAKVSGEPQFLPGEVVFDRLSVMERLNVPLIVDRYVGIPHCVNRLISGNAEVAWDAAYSLTSLTVGGRFRISATTGNFQFIYLAFDAATYLSLAMHPTGASAGKIRATARVGGVETVFHTSPDTYADDLWHTAVFGILDQTTSYLMIDNEVVSTYTPAASIEPHGGGVIWIAQTMVGSFLDVRTYNTYLTPDEARSVFAARIEGDETGVVGSWRCDDNSGPTINDYSATANDATLAGVENTDYRWDPSDLGEPQLAGLPMSVAHGQVYNAPLTLTDSARERYRYSDRRAPSSPTFVGKDQGSVLTLTTDYTLPDAGVVDKVAQADEPMSFDFSVPDSTEDMIASPLGTGGVLYSLLVTRGGFAAATIDGDWVVPFGFANPCVVGYFTDSEVALATAVADLIGGSGGFLWETAEGLFAPGLLFPPAGLSPRGEPTIEFLDAGRADFGDIADQTGSHSVAAWVKNHRIEFTLSGTTEGPIVSKHNPVSGNGYYLELTTGEKVRFFNGDLTPTALDSPVRSIKRDVWYFVVGVYDHTAHTRSIYLAEKGQSLVVVATESGITGTPVGNAVALRVGAHTAAIGQLGGASSEPQVWGKALTLAEAQALMDTPPVGNEANLSFYAPLNDGVGNATVVEKVAGGTGTLSGFYRWAPQLTLNLDAPEVTLKDLRNLIPAWKVSLQFAHNYMPMDEANIDSTVSQTDGLKLKQPHQTVFLENEDTKADYLDARHVTLMSPYQVRSQAERVTQLLMSRLGPGHVLIALDLAPYQQAGGGVVTPPSVRQAIVLRLTDEVLIKGSPRWEIPAAGRSMRVVGRKVNYSGLTTGLLLWG